MTRRMKLTDIDPVTNRGTQKDPRSSSRSLEVNRNEVLKLQTAYVDEMRARRQPYTVFHTSREFDVLPGVFPPYLDSELMVRAMRVEPHDDVLDVGSGTGVIAVHAALRGRRVVATDINPTAVKTIRVNAIRHGVEDRLTAFQADIFPQLAAAAFTVVTFNPPYTDHPATGLTERSVWDPDHLTVKRFLSGVSDILRPHGRIYLGWADFADLGFIEGLMADHDLRFRRIDEAADGLSLFVVYEMIRPKR